MFATLYLLFVYTVIDAVVKVHYPNEKVWIDTVLIVRYIVSGTLCFCCFTVIASHIVYDNVLNTSTDGFAK